MKNVIITGASGMTGGLVLNHCLNHPEIGKITSLVRRSSGIQHEKLTEIVHADFTDFSAIQESLTGQDIAYYCIGVYTGAVPRDQFRTITVDYTIAFVDILKAKSPDAAFCFLSGMGADRTEKSRAIFAKDKGIAENYILGKELARTHIFRPAYIYPVTPREEPNFGYRVYRWLYPLMKRIFPSGVITSEQLAEAMFITGLRGTGLDTLENEDIKKILI